MKWVRGHDIVGTTGIDKSSSSWTCRFKRTGGGTNSKPSRLRPRLISAIRPGSSGEVWP